MKTTKESYVSIWIDRTTLPKFPTLAANARADVCVVGAGIAGLTTAYLLTRAGKSVIILEAGSIISGETQRTTAHLVTALDDRYFELECLHGEEGAKLAAESHAAAIDTIERIVREEAIDCDFERVNGYLFSVPGTSSDVLDRELAATHRAGLTKTKIVRRAPWGSFDTGRALLFPRQAQFHPLKYLTAVAAAIVRDGGRIFAHTRAAKIDGGESAQVETREGFHVSCDAIVVATNTPANDRLVIHTKQAAYQTYAIGIAVPAGTVPKALYWDDGDPFHYVRVQQAAPGNSHTAHDILIVGGEDHKSGQADDAEARYAKLEAWTRQRFPMADKIRYRWSGQVMVSVDRLAFIGRNPLDDDNVYVATGDSGTGLTHGTIAGMLITDLIMGRENPWTNLYRPSRVNAGAAENYVNEAANMVVQFADWLTTGDVEKDQLVPLGTGAIVRHGPTKVAVFREADGTFHECSAVCPHLGGIVRWNHAEKTWDCPAHGSRFDRLGKVFHGPANQDLTPVEVHAH